MMRASNRVRLGVVGLGRIGGLHAENLAGRVSSVELVRVVDIEPELALAAGERHGVDWSTSYEDLVGEIDEVTAVGAALSDPAFADVGDVDNAVVVLRFASGALGVIDGSRVAGYGYECSTEVMGSRATVRVDHHRRAHIEWLTPGAATVDWVEDFTQ